MEDRYKLFEKIFNINEKLTKGWIYLAFCDNQLEANFQTYLHNRKSNVYKIVSLILFMFYVPLIITAFMYIGYSCAYFYLIIVCLFLDLIIVVIYFLVNNKNLKKFFEYFKFFLYFMCILSIGSYYINHTNDSFKILRIIYILIFVKNLLYLVIMDNSIFLSVLIFMISCGFLMYCNLNKQFENLFTMEICLELIISFIMYFFKDYIDKLTRITYLNKHKFKQFFFYSNDIIAGIEGMHFTYINHKLAFVNKNLKSFITEDEKNNSNLQNSKINNNDDNNFNNSEKKIDGEEKMNNIKTNDLPMNKNDYFVINSNFKSKNENKINTTNTGEDNKMLLGIGDAIWNKNPKLFESERRALLSVEKTLPDEQGETSKRNENLLIKYPQDFHKKTIKIDYKDAGENYKNIDNIEHKSKDASSIAKYDKIVKLEDKNFDFKNIVKDENNSNYYNSSFDNANNNIIAIKNNNKFERTQLKEKEENFQAEKHIYYINGPILTNIDKDHKLASASLLDASNLVKITPNKEEISHYFNTNINNDKNKIMFHQSMANSNINENMTAERDHNKDNNQHFDTKKNIEKDQDKERDRDFLQYEKSLEIFLSKLIWYEITIQKNSQQTAVMSNNNTNKNNTDNKNNHGEHQELDQKPGNSSLLQRIKNLLESKTKQNTNVVSGSISQNNDNNSGNRNNNLKNKNISSKESHKLLERTNQEGNSNSFKKLGQFYKKDEEDKIKFYIVYYRIDENIIDIILHDNTTVKLAEKQTIENSLKQKILAKIAHEFKTPLNSIIGLIMQIKENFKTNFFFKKPNKKITKKENFAKNSSLVKTKQSNLLGSKTVSINMNSAKSNKNLHKRAHHSYNQIKNTPSCLEHSAYAEQISKTKKIIFKDLILIEYLSNYTIYLINDVINFINSDDKFSEIECIPSKVNIKQILKFCFQILKALISCNENKLQNINPKLVIDEKIQLYKVSSDEVRLNQIILNFISNAVKFTREGSIMIKANIDENKLLNISVQDTGIGIKEDDKKFIFADNKIKTNYEFNKFGSGLGLSICRVIAEKLEHKLEFKSEYNFGSSFIIKIKTQERENKSLHKRVLLAAKRSRTKMKSNSNLFKQGKINTMRAFKPDKTKSSSETYSDSDSYSDFNKRNEKNNYSINSFTEGYSLMKCSNTHSKSGSDASSSFMYVDKYDNNDKNNNGDSKAPLNSDSNNINNFNNIDMNINQTIINNKLNKNAEMDNRNFKCKFGIVTLNTVSKRLSEKLLRRNYPALESSKFKSLKKTPSLIDSSETDKTRQIKSNDLLLNFNYQNCTDNARKTSDNSINSITNYNNIINNFYFNRKNNYNPNQIIKKFYSDISYEYSFRNNIKNNDHIKTNINYNINNNKKPEVKKYNKCEEFNKSIQQSFNDVNIEIFSNNSDSENIFNINSSKSILENIDNIQNKNIINNNLDRTLNVFDFDSKKNYINLSFLNSSINCNSEKKNENLPHNSANSRINHNPNVNGNYINSNMSKFRFIQPEKISSSKLIDSFFYQNNSIHSNSNNNSSSSIEINFINNSLSSKSKKIGHQPISLPTAAAREVKQELQLQLQLRQDSCKLCTHQIHKTSNNCIIENIDNVNHIINSNNNLNLSRVKNNCFTIFSANLKKNSNINKNLIKLAVVDDNKYIRSSIKRILEKLLEENLYSKNRKQRLEYEIIEGSDGVDILKFITEDHLYNRIKCIFTDESMEFLNGSEAIRIIREMEKRDKIKQSFIVSISSFEDFQTKTFLESVGANYVTRKPISKSVIKDLLKKLEII